MLKLLKRDNFLLLFLGRIVANIGDSLYYVASMWLVHELGGNPFYTGLAGFLILLPGAFQFLTGPFVDKWRIKKVLITTQWLQAVLILIIPLAYVFNFLSVTLILVLIPCVACIQQFAYPTQTKALPLILKQSELVKGNSLFSFAYQGVDTIFNAVSGIIVALFGAIVIYLVNSATFTIATILFSFVTIPQKTLKEQGKQSSLKQKFSSYKQDLTEGILVVFHSLLWVFLTGPIVLNFANGILMAILPVYADELGGVKMYGFLLTSVSAGALIGALSGSVLGKFRVGRLAGLCFVLGAVSLFLSGWLSLPAITPLLLGIAWIPIGAVNVLFAAVHQSVIPNRLLGRLNSVMYSVSIIAMPIGSLAGGALATLIDSRIIFTSTSLGFIFIALVWLVHPDLRRLPQAEQMDASTLHLKIKENQATT